MKITCRSTVRLIAAAAALLCLVAVTPAVATTPQYQIYDIGVIDSGDTASQGFGVSRARNCRWPLDRHRMEVRRSPGR